MLLKNIKFGKFYNFVNTGLIIFCILTMFTGVNILGVFVIGIVTNTVIFAVSNFSLFISLIKDDYRRVLYFLLCPIVFTIITLLHKDFIPFLFQIWVVLYILPFIAICLREVYKVPLRSLYYAFIISGLILLVRLIVFLSGNYGRFAYIAPYNSIHVGLLVGMYSSVCLYMAITFFNRKKVYSGVCATILTLISLVSLLAVASKGPILGYLFIALVIIICNINWKKTLALLAIIIAITSVLFIFFKPFIMDKLDLKRFNEIVNIEQQYKQKEFTSTGIRLQLYKVGVKAFASSPIVGLSYADVTKLEKQMAKDHEITPDVIHFFHFHNDLLNSLGHYGILGGVSLVIFWIMLFAFCKPSCARKSRLNVDTKNIMIAIFGVYIVSSFTDAYMIGSTSPTLVLLFVCSVIYSLKIGANK